MAKRIMAERGPHSLVTSAAAKSVSSVPISWATPGIVTGGIIAGAGAMTMALLLPFHFALIPLALFGVLHTASEAHFWIKEERILWRRKVYPPLLLFGAFAFATIPFLLVWTQFNSSGDALLFGRIYYAGICLYVLAVWLVARSQNANAANNQGTNTDTNAAGSQNQNHREPKDPGQTRRHAINSTLVAAITLGSAALSLWHPLAAAFVLVHGHNLTPWFFLYRRFGKQVIWHFLWAGLLIPAAGCVLFVWLRLTPSELGFAEALEVQLFNHTIPHFSLLDPPLLLLSVFAYQQLLHYVLWLVVLPRREFSDLLRRPGAFLNELLVFVGLRPKQRPFLHAVVWLAVLASAILFATLPQQWRPLYFALVMFHVLAELPLLFLFRP